MPAAAPDEAPAGGAGGRVRRRRRRRPPSRPAGPGRARRSIGTQAGRLERGEERVGVADEDDRGLVRPDMRPSRGDGVVRRDRLDRRAIARQLVVGQPLDDEPAERPDHGARGLEAEREDTDEIVARLGDLGLGDARTDPVELGQDVDAPPAP